MERRVLKRAPTSAEMNKISDSFSRHREREICKVKGWFYWQRVYTAIFAKLNRIEGAPKFYIQ